MSECSNCGNDGATKTLTINNSKFTDEDQYLTEKDVPFEVDFSGHPDDPDLEVVSVTICKKCYNNIKF